MTLDYQDVAHVPNSARIYTLLEFLPTLGQL